LKSSHRRTQGLSKIFRALIYRAHRAVIFAVAQLSCLNWHTLPADCAWEASHLNYSNRNAIKRRSKIISVFLLQIDGVSCTRRCQWTPSNAFKNRHGVWINTEK